MKVQQAIRSSRIPLREVLGFVGKDAGGGRHTVFSDDGATAWYIEHAHFIKRVDRRRRAQTAEFFGGPRTMYNVHLYLPWCDGLIVSGRLYDAHTLQSLHGVPGLWHSGRHTSVVSRRRHLVASGAHDHGAGPAIVTRVGRARVTVLCELPLLAPLAFSPSGDVLAGVDEAGSLRAFSVDARRCLWTTPLPGLKAWALAVSDGGAFVVALVSKALDRAMYSPPSTCELLCTDRSGTVVWRHPTEVREGHEGELSIVDDDLCDAYSGGLWRRVRDGARIDRRPSPAPSLSRPFEDETPSVRYAHGRYAQCPAEGEDPPRSGHDAPVTALAPSPDGVRIAAADERGRVAVHRLGDVVPERCLYVSEGVAVVALAWARDGERLAVATASSILVWHAAEAGAVTELALSSLGFDASARLEQVACGEGGAVIAVATSSGATTLCGLDLSGDALRWSVESGAPLEIPLELSSDGRAVRSGPATWRDIVDGRCLEADIPVAREVFATHGATRCSVGVVRTRGQRRWARLAGAAVEFADAPHLARISFSSTVGGATALAYTRAGGADLLLVGTTTLGVLVIEL